MKWNDYPEFNLVIMGRSDSDFAKDQSSIKSASGTSTFLCGPPIMQRSTMHEIVPLSVTEDELITLTSKSQDMTYEEWLRESKESQVKLPMIYKRDNNGAADLLNDIVWVVGQSIWRQDNTTYTSCMNKEQS